VSDCLRRREVKPHLVRTYKVSRDPQFAAEGEGCRRAVLEAAGARDRPERGREDLDPGVGANAAPLPLRSGRANPAHARLQATTAWSISAHALEVATGKVTHEVSESHTAEDFLSFMRKVVRAYPKRELHVILDNSSAHGTPEIRRWLDENPLVKFHFTPTSASWLNQVEGFFGILGKQSLFMNDFKSRKALADHIKAYMKAWNKNPTPFEWTKPAKAIIQFTSADADRTRRRCTRMDMSPSR